MDHNALVLDVTKDALTNYPHFTQSQWPDFNDPNYINRIYEAYWIRPYPGLERGTRDNTDHLLR